MSCLFPLIMIKKLALFLSLFVAITASGSCPESHRFVYLNGDYCCRTNKEKVHSPAGRKCDGSIIAKDSVCCLNDDHVACPDKPCENFHGVKYTVVTITSEDAYSEVKRDTGLRVRIEGTYMRQSNTIIHTVTTGYLRENFRYGAIDMFKFTGLADVGEIQCIEPFVEGNDWWKFSYIKVYSERHPTPRYFYNKSKRGLSSDSSEGPRNMRLCDGKVPTPLAEGCIKNNYNYGGDDIKMIPGIGSIAECVKECLILPFVWGGGTYVWAMRDGQDICRSVTFVEGTGDCWLKYSDTGALLRRGTMEGVTSVSISCTIGLIPDQCIKKDRKYDAAVIKMVEGIATIAECVQECFKQHKDCMYVNYAPAGASAGRCWLQELGEASKTRLVSSVGRRSVDIFCIREPEEQWWRSDGRCGGYYRLSNGLVGQCNPDDPNGYVCCSPYEWCGKTPAHCDCAWCINYGR